MSAPADTVLRWSEHGLVAVADEPVGALLAADSWLVAGGAVRALDAHWGRFGGWCGALGVPQEEFEGFRAAVTAALPRGPGRWFPRVEAVGAGPAPVPADVLAPPVAARPSYAALRLVFRLRAAPAPAGAARVLLGAHGDPRARPTWKGPDLERLLTLRSQALAEGADELLLRDTRGRLLEGALSSLLWWEDDTLCTTPAEHTLPAITRALLLDLARRRGVTTRTRLPSAAELAGCETWLTSALHGIRPVAWGPVTRAPAWQAALAGMAQPLPAAD